MVDLTRKILITAEERGGVGRGPDATFEETRRRNVSRYVETNITSLPWGALISRICYRMTSYPS